MKQKDFNKTINEVLDEGKIENKDIKNIDTLRYILEDKKNKHQKNIELRCNLVDLINDLDFLKQYLENK